MKHAKVRTRLGLVTALAALFLLSSCVGINADIVLNQDGSGTLALEYRVSLALDSLGRLDGNERWNTIPVGRADFERTLDRLPGIELLSFSSKGNEADIVTTAKMKFESIQSLLALMDAGGLRSSFSGDGKSGRIRLTLSEGTGLKDPKFAALVEEISEPYSFAMAMSFPGEGNLSVTNSRGEAIAAMPGSEIHSNGKTVSFSFPLYGVLSSAEGIGVEFGW